MSWSSFVSGVGDFFGNIVSPIASLFGAGQQIKQSNENYAFQKEAFDRNFGLQKDWLEYQKGLQNTIFSREDNAVQRRASDLQAAGLSKTLAAGSGAGVGTVVGTTAPQQQVAQRDTSIWKDLLGIDSILSSMDKVNQVKMSSAQAKIAQHDAGIVTATPGFTSEAQGEFWFQAINAGAKALGYDSAGDLLGSLLNKFRINPKNLTPSAGSNAPTVTVNSDGKGGKTRINIDITKAVDAILPKLGPTLSERYTHRTSNDNAGAGNNRKNVQRL